MEFDESRKIIDAEFLSLYVFNPFLALLCTLFGCVLQNTDSVEIIILFNKKVANCAKNYF